MHMLHIIIPAASIVVLFFNNVVISVYPGGYSRLVHRSIIGLVLHRGTLARSIIG